QANPSALKSAARPRTTARDRAVVANVAGRIPMPPLWLKRLQRGGQRLPWAWRQCLVGCAVGRELRGGRDGDHARDPPAAPVSVLREPPLRRRPPDTPGVGASSALYQVYR